MKKMKVFLIASMAATAFSAVAQPPIPDVKYRRSSLYTLMVDDAQRERADVISKSFLEFPLSEKFNDHNLEVRTISSKANDKEQQKIIDSFLYANGIARKVVARWFNRADNGAFNMKLVAQRGSYNASEMDASIAQKTKKGSALLEDAGEELIGNTFVLVSDFKYVNKEEVAAKAKAGLAGLSMAASFVPGAGSVSTAADLTSTAATVAGKGYVVKTTSYLYQLVWNDSVATNFYDSYWMDQSSVNASRKAAFDRSDAFYFKFIGSEVAWADVQSSIFTSKTEDELVVMATRKALDAVIAKLQRNHEVFRTKTPLFTTEPLTAKIGLKEGLEKNDKYIVLEQRVNEDGRTVYEKVGMLKVDGTQIWDNRYMADADTSALQSTDRTLFRKTSGKDFYPGLLIKQK